MGPVDWEAKYQYEQSPRGYTVPQLGQGFLQPQALEITSKPQRLQRGRADRSVTAPDSPRDP